METYLQETANGVDAEHDYRELSGYLEAIEAALDALDQNEQVPAESLDDPIRFFHRLGMRLASAADRDLNQDEFELQL